MLTQLKQIINRANPHYRIVYEDKYMANIVADSNPPDTSVAYIEEFINGNYTEDEYRKIKIVKAQIYFCKFVKMHQSAEVRQQTRNRIEQEIVVPFIRQFNLSSFKKQENFAFAYPPCRWDASEVGILLTFECTQTIC